MAGDRDAAISRARSVFDDGTFVEGLISLVASDRTRGAAMVWAQPATTASK